MGVGSGMFKGSGSKTLRVYVYVYTRVSSTHLPGQNMASS